MSRILPNRRTETNLKCFSRFIVDVTLLTSFISVFALPLWFLMLIPCSLQHYIGFIVKMDLLMMLQSLSALKLQIYFFLKSFSTCLRYSSNICKFISWVGPLPIKPSASLVNIILWFNVSIYVASFSVAVNAHVFYRAIEKKKVAEFSCTSVHIYVWMIVLCPSIWIVFYTLPQHLSGQLSVQLIFVFLSFLMLSTVGDQSINFICVITTTVQILNGGGGASTKLDDQPSMMTAIDGNVLRPIFTICCHQ